MGTLLVALGGWFAVSLAVAMFAGPALRRRAVVRSRGGIDPLAVLRQLPEGAAVPVNSLTTRELERRRIASIIEESAFAPHYQPILDLTDHAQIGVEALTRFDDGATPEARFHHAATLGLGIELELATLRRAVNDIDGAAPGFLAVNVSPSLLRHPTLLAGVLAHADRPIVVELSEQEAVADYDELLRELDLLPNGVRLSVDDAGSGFASLRHILLLRPAYVKFDRSWVHDVHVDPARQALIAGLRQFAEALGATLVAEGVEQEAERDTLVGLGVPYGQGWLLGHPQPVERLATAFSR